jgi:hypothetical protein
MSAFTTAFGRVSVSDVKTKRTDIPPALTLVLIFATIKLIKADVVYGVAAVGLIIFDIFASIFTCGIPIATYADSETPEQTVDAALYDCTKNLATRPGGDADLAGSNTTT